MKYRRRAKLTPEEIKRLKQDLAMRDELRAVMSENSDEVLSVEFGVSTRTILQREKKAPAVTPYARLTLETMQAIYRRRKLYWQARDLHDSKFSRKLILERFNINKTTLVRYMHAMRDERRQVDEDFRAEERRAA